MAAARRHHVDGVLLNPATEAQRDVALRVGAGSVPMVMLGEVEQHDVDQVWVDSVDAARRMTAFLIGLGHRRIAMARRPAARGRGRSPGALRRDGYRAALAAGGHSARPAARALLCSAWSPEGGAGAMARLLADVGRPDAVFCATDSIAIGALSALWSAGVRVPDEVSVAGFDDIVEGEFGSPPLTTVRWDKRAYARIPARAPDPRGSTASTAAGGAHPLPHPARAPGERAPAPLSGLPAAQEQDRPGAQEAP